jgi:hypothetical protein
MYYELSLPTFSWPIGICPRLQRRGTQVCSFDSLRECLTIVAHGLGDGIGKTMYTTIRQRERS